MTDFRAFAALRYVRDPEPRLAPPYDVISAAERARLADEPENIVHLTLPPGAEGERDYDAAARTLVDWRRDGVLVRDSQSQLYVLEERTTDGRVRRGFLGQLGLADYAEGSVLPHERTMAGPKLDRLRLTRAVRANLEPLFFLYDDRGGKLDATLDEAVAGARLVACRGPDDTRLALYGLTAPTAIEVVRAYLAERPTVIADGHHRYETMLEYRNECRGKSEGEADPEAPHEFVLAYLVNAFDPGSQVRAIHRGLRGEVADVTEILDACGFERRILRDAGEAERVLEELRSHAEASHVFAIAQPDGGIILALRARGEPLDVEVLHEELLARLGGQLHFDSRPDRLLANVRAGRASLGIFLNPIDPESLFRVVRAGGLLPEKSTFFTPKVPSGVVIRDGV